ncbi:MAG: hypothetical protein WKF77_18095 [Planctomycetaceae bacterium]
MKKAGRVVSEDSPQRVVLKVRATSEIIALDIDAVVRACRLCPKT